MRIDVLEKIAKAAGFAGACDDDGNADTMSVQSSPDIPAPRAAPVRSTAVAIVDARSMQASATWLAAAPTTVARGLSNLLGRGATA